MDRIWVERKPAGGSARQDFDGIPEPKEARNRVDNCVQDTETDQARNTPEGSCP